MTRPVSARAIHNLIKSGEEVCGADFSEVVTALVERMFDQYDRCDTIEEHLRRLMKSDTLIIRDGKLMEPTIEQLMELQRNREMRRQRSTSRPGNLLGSKHPRGRGGLKGFNDKRTWHGRPRRDRKRLRGLRSSHTSIGATR